MIQLFLSCFFLSSVNFCSNLFSCFLFLGKKKRVVQQSTLQSKKVSFEESKLCSHSGCFEFNFLAMNSLKLKFKDKQKHNIYSLLVVMWSCKSPTFNSQKKSDSVMLQCWELSHKKNGDINQKHKQAFWKQFWPTFADQSQICSRENKRSIQFKAINGFFCGSWEKSQVFCEKLIFGWRCKIWAFLLIFGFGLNYSSMLWKHDTQIGE